MEKIFRLKEHNTDIKTEIVAGITTFMTMAYILAINPAILSVAGMDSTAVLLATCMASFIGTACMAFMANLPFALSAGMGLNAFMAYTVVQGYGYSWQVALFAIFIEGIIFIVLSLTSIREAIFDAIPLSLKKAVSVGMGLFIAFIGLQNAGLAVADSSTLIKIVDFTENFRTSGICALLAVIGVFVTIVLSIKNVKGSILIGILGTWVLGMLCEVAGIYTPDAQAGYYTLFPTLRLTDFSRFGETFGQCFHIDMSNVNGRLPNIKAALMADSIATTAGAVLGTSTTTTFVESSAGVAAGGRTGLTAITTAVLFLISMLFAPVFTAIPSFATAPALIMVGFLMFSSITDIRFTGDNYTTAIPAYLCILAMPLFYSISEGISIGIISYVLIHLICGKRKEVNWLMTVLAILFILKYIFL